MIDFYKEHHFKKHIQGSQVVVGSDGKARELSNAQVAAVIANANLEIFLKKGGKFIHRPMKRPPMHIVT